MSEKSVMLRLPEVAYLVDRIPIARCAIKPTAVHLRFLQHARETRMPLRQQCEALNIPWHARKVPAEAVRKVVLKAARLVAPSLFGQTFPADRDLVKRWADHVIWAQANELPSHSFRWFVFHSREITDSPALLPYLKKVGALSASVTHAVVVDRARKAARRRPEVTTIHIGHRDGGLIVPEYIESVMRDVFFGRPPNAPERGPVDVSPLVYPAELAVQHSDLSAEMLRTPDDFNRAGSELQNCIRASGAPVGSLVLFAGSGQNFFAHAKAGRGHMAVVRQAGTAIAAGLFGPDWSLQQARGRRNAPILKPAILTALIALGEKGRQLMPAPAPAPNMIVGVDPGRGMIVDEWEVTRPEAAAIRPVERD